MTENNWFVVRKHGDTQVVPYVDLQNMLNEGYVIVHQGNETDCIRWMNENL